MKCDNIGFISQDRAKIFRFDIDEYNNFKVSEILDDKESKILDMKFIKSIDSLLVYLSGPKSRLILIGPNLKPKIVLSNFVGSPKYNRTIQISNDSSHILLSHKGSSLKLLYNLDEDGHCRDIPMNFSYHILSHVAYESNKVIVLTKESKIKIVKFTSFGFNETIAEN